MKGLFKFVVANLIRIRKDINLFRFNFATYHRLVASPSTEQLQLLLVFNCISSNDLQAKQLHWFELMVFDLFLTGYSFTNIIYWIFSQNTFG